MTAWFNPSQMSPAFSQNLRFNLALHCHANPMQAQSALQQIQQFQQGGQFGCFPQQQLAPGCGSMPPPSPQFSGAPAGKGLTKDPAGFPAGSVRTAGGYTVVPEGKSAAWSVYGPGQKVGEKPHTRVWGDPHVDEKDGTRWDFTKSSDFALPDGTRIALKTTAETGRSVSKSMTITNGADRVNIDGLNGGSPQTGGVKNDGYEWRAQHIGSNPNRDTFRLGGDKKNVQWFKESGGKDLGLITGATYNGREYLQTTDGSKKYTVDQSLRPQFGTAAWGNQLRSELTDTASQIPGMNQAARQYFAQFMSADHMMGQLGFMGGFGFGGMPSYFGNAPQAFGSVNALGDMMLMQQLAAMQTQQFQAGHMWA